MLSQVKIEKFTFKEDPFLWDSLFFFGFFHISENESNAKGPPSPKAERLMVAAFAARGLNFGSEGSDTIFSG